MGFILYLCFFIISMCVAYFIIKTAVRHAIHESLEELKPAIRDSVKTALIEHDWNKRKEV